MPPRPVIKTRQGRPVSAVYIGKGPSPSLQDLSNNASGYASLIDGTPPTLPDLPEPASPVSSHGSVKSGLPSPPATNSTGSGSTGDPATIALRQRPLSHHSNSSTSTGGATPVARSSSRSSTRSEDRLSDMKIEDLGGVEGDFDDDYDKENDIDNESNFDGDDTARLDRRLLANKNMSESDLRKSSSEHITALQKVKTLAQRNRMALDKLSRLGSPSPARSGTPNTRSPAPSHSSSNSSKPSNSNPLRQPRALPPEGFKDPTRSGSETERESTHHSNSNSTHSSQSTSSRNRSSSSSYQHSPSVSSSQLSTTTPPPQPQSNSSYHRRRQVSAPTSPNQSRVSGAGSSESSASTSNIMESPSNRRRNRLSVASVSQLQLADFTEEDDDEHDLGPKTATGTAKDRTRERTLNERDLIIQSALAAAATSRSSPLGNRRRSALPKEFRSDLADENSSSKHASGRHSAAGRYEIDDKRESWKNKEPVTPFRPTANVGRSSTLRDTRHSGGSNGRWSSDDFRSSATVRDRANNSSLLNEDSRRERRQSLRGGSAESILGWSPGGRSLLGEGLRAAGLSRRKDDESRGPPSASTVGSDVFRERELYTDRDRRVDWSPQDILQEGRRKVFSERERDKQPARASTSMAHYQYRDQEDDTAEESREREGGRELVKNRHRSDYGLSSREHDSRREPSISRRERTSLPADRAESALGRYHNPPVPQSPALLAAHLQDRRSTSSPFGSRRYSVSHSNLTSSQSQLEPAKLLLESLSMFESQLNKLPLSVSTSSTGTGSSQVELSRNAQGVVFSAERLSALMKHGSTKALEAQVATEVDSTSNDASLKEIADIWGKVASDYRDGSRVADELVRGLTALLLGMGRVVRDFSTTSSEYGSPLVHGRHASLDEDRPDASSSTSGVVDGSNSAESGRHSSASRRSWEPLPRDKEKDREEALRRLAGGGTRPESVLARASPATFQKLKDRAKGLEGSGQSSENRDSVPLPRSSGSIRRLFTPREQREKMLDARAASVNAVLRGGANLATLDSQETVKEQPNFESPTPASKTRPSPPQRQKTLTPLSIPKPLPVLPSETQVRRSSASLAVSANSDKSTSSRDRERRRSTLRGAERPSFPSITTPSNATTAVTPHTVSNSPGITSPPLPRTNSEQSTRSQVTFSRPIASSVSATLSDIHQQHERNRTLSASSSSAEAGNSVIPDSKMPNLSASESERDVKPKTLGSRTLRASLDGQPAKEERSPVIIPRNVNVHAADRSAATTILQQSAGSSRDRRRTVTDIWPRE
ncbi:hypothetical protein JR316_0007282 [Psilocybe cubensis]|uniref:Uncharacterized protein n=2 Tax=Psilocybe cubensis TaxID=181762 RepID=A0A8H7XSJ4_PSICU|nr:hypothetical protein JR316_0007282 [Psilocybe cubensis]KAH9480682.1 hypothetical protein JR316_0007282 [Psilocybe cubensis]